MAALPQLIYLALLVLGIGVSMAKFGETKGQYGLIDIVVGPVIAFSLLWWGGFFDPLLSHG